jgi:ribosomal protein S18 acetylase RimI-like enzyme
VSEIIAVDWPHGLIALRPERPADRDFRYALFCRSRLPEWDMVDRAFFAQVMPGQFQAQTASYAAEFPTARFDIIELDGQPIGRIVVDSRADVVHLVDQAIVPEQRNRGIGTAIMRDLMARAAAAGLPVQLEVASDNDPCIGLYRRLGFEQTEVTDLYLRMLWRPAG